MDRSLIYAHRLIFVAITMATSSATNQDYLQLAERIMDDLSDVRLETHPHFRILPPSRQEDEPRLWEVGGRNEMGYIMDDEHTDTNWYSTTLCFKVRTSITNFLDVQLTIKKIVGRGGFEVDMRIGEEPPIHQVFAGRDGLLNIPVIGGRDPRSIKLHIVKDVKQLDGMNTILFKISNETTMERIQEGQRRFDFGNLLDLSVAEESEKPFACDLPSIKSYGLLPIAQPNSRTITLRDYYIASTRIPRPKVGTVTIAELADLITKNGGGIDELVQAYFQAKLEAGGGRLYSFQTRAIEELFAQMNGPRKPCVIIARTAAGKTEAFMIPILTRVLELKKSGSKGVKALLLYPTKALAADQLQRFLDIAYWVNQSLEDKLTIGVYHGDIEERASLKIPLPLHCVKHDTELESGEMAAGQIRLQAGKDSVLACPLCQEKYPFIEADRYSTTLNPPDILVCTPDILNRILMTDRSRHVFLGARIEVASCPNCKEILRGNPESCPDCGASTTVSEVAPTRPPDIILLDELHLFNSIFGGNVSNLLKRLQMAMIRYGGPSSSKVQFVATSATVKNPIEFGTDFFGREVSVVQTSDEEYDFTDPYSKVVVFASPRAYRMIDSVSYALYIVLGRTPLRSLVFVNSLMLSNMLLNNIKHRLSADANTSSLTDQVDGHSSNYTRQERAETEEKFNSGRIRALVATSTLEVGVDFKGLNGLMLYGAPPNFNNYLQRIGRAGRKNDAIVFVFLKPDDPIDLYYFRNSLKLAADPTTFIEYPPFPVGNDVLERKHILCTIYDAACILGVDVTPLLKSFMQNASLSNVEGDSYLQGIWSDVKVKAASVALASAARGTPDQLLSEYISKRFNLFDIRKVDETVKVDFDEPRQATRADFGGTGARRRGPSYSAYRRAGLTQRDIDTLREIKGQ